MATWWGRRKDDTREATAPTSATHVGPVADAKVQAATERLRARGESADYDLVRDNFDVMHYFLQAPRLVDQPQVDAVRNFLREGPRQRRTPQINFSVSAYLSRHPERGQDPETNPYVAWLREGRAAGEIADPAVGLEKMSKMLGVSPGMLADELGRTRLDLQERLRHGRLGEMFAKAAVIDPLVGDAWQEAARPKLTPLPAPLVVDQMSAVYLCHEAAGFRRADVLLVADRPDSSMLTELLSTLHGQVAEEDIVVLVTGPGGTPAGPSGVRYVDFDSAAADLDGANAQWVLAELVRSYGSKVIVGVESALFLDTLTPYGKALRASERVFLCLADLESGPLGNPSGAALRYFYRHVDVVEGFLCAGEQVLQTLQDVYQLPDDVTARLHLATDASAWLRKGELP